MTDVSDARQAVRDYAREHVIVTEAKVTVNDQPPETGVSFRFAEGEHLIVGVRGEHAGKIFEALQAVLTICEEVRVGKRITSPLGIVNTMEWAIEQVMKR